MRDCNLWLFFLITTYINSKSICRWVELECSAIVEYRHYKYKFGIVICDFAFFLITTYYNNLSIEGVSLSVVQYGVWSMVEHSCKLQLQDYL